MRVRDRIIDQAEHLIHLRGYRATSLDDIAKACRMTKANLFHHYGSKEELGLAVLDAKIADYRQRRIENGCRGREPVAAVDCLFKEARKLFSGNGCRAGCFVGNIALEMSDINDSFRERAGLFFEEWSRHFAQCLRLAKARGEFEASLNPTASAEAIISLYEGAIMLARTRRDPGVFSRVGKLACALIEQQKKKHGG